METWQECALAEVARRACNSICGEQLGVESWVKLTTATIFSKPKKRETIIISLLTPSKSIKIIKINARRRRNPIRDSRTTTGESTALCCWSSFCLTWIHRRGASPQKIDIFGKSIVHAIQLSCLLFISLFIFTMSDPLEMAWKLRTWISIHQFHYTFQPGFWSLNLSLLMSEPEVFACLTPKIVSLSLRFLWTHGPRAPRKTLRKKSVSLSLAKIPGLMAKIPGARNQCFQPKSITTDGVHHAIEIRYLLKVEFHYKPNSMRIRWNICLGELAS